MPTDDKWFEIGAYSGSRDRLLMKPWLFPHYSFILLMHHNPVTMGLGYSETYASNWVNCLERLPSDYSQLAFSVFNFDLLLLWNKKYKISVIALPIGPTAWLMLPPFCWPAACECRNSFQDELPKAFLFSPTLRFISFFVFFCCFILLNTGSVTKGRFPLIPGM